MPNYTTYYALAKPLVNSPVDEDLWGGELNDNMDIIDTTLHDLAVGTGGAYVPSGALMDFAGTAAPTGWLLCYGQLVSRTTYADLFTAIGTTWGAGDGSTTFGIPDFRGRIGAGKDDMGGTAANRLTTAASGVDGLTVGAVGGSQTHTLTTAQLASHTHAVTVASSGAHTHTIEGATGVGSVVYTDLYTGGSTQLFGASAGVTTSIAGASNYMGNNSATGVALRAKSTGSAHTHTGTADAAGSGDAHNNVQPTAVVLKIIKT